MNILLVNWQDRQNPQAGGAEVHLFEIFERLAAAGHRVRLVCSGWEGAPSSVMVDGIQVERSGGRSSFAIVGREAVRRAIRAERPDVLVEDINKLPLYLGRQGVRFCAIVPHLFGETVFREAAWPLATAVYLAERPIPYGYRDAPFHVISESTRDDLVARGVPSGHVRVIHPGVDSAKLTPDPAGTRTSAPTFLYVGRLKRYKGVEYAIRALAIARRTRPELRLVIAGAGDHLVALRRLSVKLGQDEAVDFRGFVTEEEKLSLLRGSWANVFPSPKEGWGITVVEAAACGTPSIASNSPGLRDSVRNGETGYLVPHADADALATRLLELAGSPTLVARLGAAARRFAESLTWEGAAAATEQHLQDIIAGTALR